MKVSKATVDVWLGMLPTLLKQHHDPRDVRAMFRSACRGYYNLHFGDDPNMGPLGFEVTNTWSDHAFVKLTDVEMLAAWFQRQGRYRHATAIRTAHSLLLLAGL